jgi:hypothetical protein
MGLSASGVGTTPGVYCCENGVGWGVGVSGTSVGWAGLPGVGLVGLMEGVAVGASGAGDESHAVKTSMKQVSVQQACTNKLGLFARKRSPRNLSIAPENLLSNFMNSFNYTHRLYSARSLQNSHTCYISCRSSEA